MSLPRAVRLLLVEPHGPVLAAIERLIAQQKLPYVLETASSQREAGWRLRGGSCDAVLLDCTNGNGGGCEIFEQAEPRLVILLMDRQSTDTACRGARLGACPCPIDPADEDSWRLLPAVVESAVGWKHRLGEARRRLGELAHIQRVATVSDMVAELAHELNQPLSAIADYARAGGYRARTLEGDGREEVIDLLGRIAGQAERAGGIVRRVRQYVRRADCPRCEADLNELVRELAVLLEVEARSRDVRLELALGDPLPKATIDRLQIEQVITNLVRNAMEAAEGLPQERRAVTIRTSQRSPGELQVAVEDKAMGLGEGDVERLFEPFYTGKTDGLGLGLSISSSIVEAHGGRLEAVPGVGAGATFCFTLPVGREGVKE